MAGGRDRQQPFATAEVRVARGIAQLAAIALAHARALEELARANRLKSEFVATMSHELRTPLNIILGYTELLRAGSFGQVTAEQRDVLGRVARSGDELLELINATLDLSRLESGRVTVDLAPVHLETLLATVAGEAREILREKPEVALRCALAPALPLVHSDATKLKVVLKNLVANAAKFTERGHISVERGAGRGRRRGRGGRHRHRHRSRCAADHLRGLPPGRQLDDPPPRRRRPRPARRPPPDGAARRPRRRRQHAGRGIDVPHLDSDRRPRAVGALSVRAVARATAAHPCR